MQTGLKFGSDQRATDRLGSCSSREDVRELWLVQKRSKGVKIVINEASGKERTGRSIGLNTER